MNRKVFACLLIWIISTPAYSLVKVPETNDEQTVQGIFTSWVYLEHEDDIPGIETDAEVTLNNKVVLQEHLVKSIQLDWMYPHKPPYQILLLSVNYPNPNECEAKFLVIDLSVKGKTIITDKFGNCASELSVKEKNGKITIKLPQFKNSPKATFEYTSKEGLKKIGHE